MLVVTNYAKNYASTIYQSPVYTFRLALDPIYLDPLGHLLTFTRRSILIAPVPFSLAIEKTTLYKLHKMSKGF